MKVLFAVIGAIFTIGVFPKIFRLKFIYPSDKNQRLILDNLNLVFEPGKKVALAGESDCGKSTTINLIERLYEPAEGQILTFCIF